MASGILKILHRAAAGWLLACAAVAGDLQIFTEENKPLNFLDGGKVTGFATEVVQAIQARLGTRSEIQLVPWSRGYQAALDEPDTMLYSTMRTEEREKLFKWVGPLTLVLTSFYGAPDGGVKIAGLDDARKVFSIGVPRSYYTEQFLRERGFTNLDVADTPAVMVRKFLAGRNPVFVSSDFTLPSVLAAVSVPDGKVVPLYTFMKDSHYLAFSRKTPDEVVRRWQAALDDLKKDGTFARLFAKWLPGKKMPK